MLPQMNYIGNQNNYYQKVCVCVCVRVLVIRDNHVNSPSPIQLCVHATPEHMNYSVSVSCKHYFFSALSLCLMQRGFCWMSE